MNYQVQTVETDKIWEHASEYTYALVYMISELILCGTQELPNLDWTECMEARFFDEDKELHIYEEDGKLQAVKVTEGDGKDVIVRKYQLANQFLKAGKLLCVREYYAYDEDGQAYVSLTRLAGIEEV